MNFIPSAVARLMALIFILLSPWAIAGSGHDHDESTSQVTGPAQPRFAAVSESLELVGIVNGKQLMLYLDRAADNSPIDAERIEIDIAGSKYIAKRHAAGEYEVTLNDTLKPGVTAITAMINVGEFSDLLTTELDLHAHEHTGLAPTHSFRYSWKIISIAIGAGLIGLMAIGLFIRSRRQARHI